MRSATVRDEEDDLRSIAELQQQRWRRHFTEDTERSEPVFAAELENCRQRPLRPHMADTQIKGRDRKCCWEDGQAGGS